MRTIGCLPDDLDVALEQSARRRGASVAEPIREALRALTAPAVPPRPRVPPFRSDDLTLAERADQALVGFGKR